MSRTPRLAPGNAGRVQRGEETLIRFAAADERETRPSAHLTLARGRRRYGSHPRIDDRVALWYLQSLRRVIRERLGQTGCGVGRRVLGVLQACTGPDKRTLESFTEASQQNDWSPERGSAAAPNEAEEALAEHLSDWISRVRVQPRVRRFLLGGRHWGTSRASRMQPKEYPLPDSTVPQALRQAEKHLTAAQAALDKRQYAKGKSELKKATQAITPVSEGVPADWAAVEKQTGVRLTSDGHLLQRSLRHPCRSRRVGRR